MRKRGYLSDFKCGIVIGAAILAVCGKPLSKKALLMPQIRASDLIHRRMAKLLNPNNHLLPRYAKEHTQLEKSNLQADGVHQQQTTLDVTTKNGKEN